MGLRKTMKFFWAKRREKSSNATDFSFSKFAWLLDHPPVGMPPVNMTADGWPEDKELAQRVMASYQKANHDFVPSASFWDTSIFKINKDIHDVLLGSDASAAATKLACPKDTSHFWGFDSIAKAPFGKAEPHQDLLIQLDPKGNWKEQYTLWTYDRLLVLATAVGASSSFNPEGPTFYPDASIGFPPSAIDELLGRIEDRLGIELEFPNPYAGEFGLTSSRGTVGFRSIQALYQAWKIAEIAERRGDFKVLEIGAGLGRTAYFANKFGVKNYSIIDVPMTNAAQGYFLGRTLGRENINLWGESNSGGVNILPASALDTLESDFDLIVNVDSLTEMTGDAMNNYWRFIQQSTPLFLSINHEANEHSVLDLYNGDNHLIVKRHPYWMRRGYVEEYTSIGECIYQP